MSYDGIWYNQQMNLDEFGSSASLLTVPDWVYWYRTLTERFANAPTVEGDVAETSDEFHVQSLSYWGSGNLSWWISDHYACNKSDGVINFVDHNRSEYAGDPSNITTSTKYVIRMTG